MIQKTITTFTLSFLAGSGLLVAASLLHLVRVDIATAYSLFTLAAVLEITRNQAIDLRPVRLPIRPVVQIESLGSVPAGSGVKDAA
jgi:hypothetical protein